jgi:hypothetical protein
MYWACKVEEGREAGQKASKDGKRAVAARSMQCQCRGRVTKTRALEPLV